MRVEKEKKKPINTSPIQREKKNHILFLYVYIHLLFFNQYVNQVLVTIMKLINHKSLNTSCHEVHDHHHNP